MNYKKLTTEPYKGVRDFYPDEMAIQRYIFNNWSKTAESFGFEQYNASILEPSALYRNKGTENAEMVNEQTYSFIDRGDREVTLRPEMTPTVARMVAGKYRELKFPLRWYAIPNLFRYERPQRGRLREHWQLNCDIFGSDDYTADIEIIALAYQTMINFGATSEMFEIQINDRSLMNQLYKEIGVDDEQIYAITILNDKRNKISNDVYKTVLESITKSESLAKKIIKMLDNNDIETEVVKGLRELGIKNIKFNKSLARGFNYYTGTIFEFFDVSNENNRSLIGGGRYNNLTTMFSDETISGVGFGAGDVSMKDFLITHKLIPENLSITAPVLIIVPINKDLNLEAQKIAHFFRAREISVSTDMNEKKIGKKITDATLRGVTYTIIFGDDEINSHIFTLKNLKENNEQKGSLEELLSIIIANTK